MQPFLQEEYYDVVEFPDGSQAGGICSRRHEHEKAQTRRIFALLEGTDACGVTAGRELPGGRQPISARRASCHLSRRRAHGAAASWRRGALHGEIQPHRVHRRRTDHTHDLRRDGDALPNRRQQRSPPSAITHRRRPSNCLLRDVHNQRVGCDARLYESFENFWACDVGIAPYAFSGS